MRLYIFVVIQVWSQTVGLVMEDDQLKASESLKSPPADLGRIAQLLVLRTPVWVKTTAGKLSVLLKKIISCTTAHQHWKVRLEMVELADHLLARCSLSLGECVGLLLEALVGAINDEEPRVRERYHLTGSILRKQVLLINTCLQKSPVPSCRCEVALREVSQRNQSSSSHQTFTNVLSENLHSLATSLPRLMRTSDDQMKLFVLNVFLGYLKVLGPLVSVILNSAAHLERISKALMQVMKQPEHHLVNLLKQHHTTDKGQLWICTFFLMKVQKCLEMYSFILSAQ